MMRKFSLVIMIIIIMTLTACSQNITNKDIANETSLEVSHQTTSINENTNIDENTSVPEVSHQTTSINENTNIDENTSAPPINQSTTQTFENIRTMKEEIDNKRNNDPQSSLKTLSSIDTSDLKELKGLNTDYIESWVELSVNDTYVTYVIYYTSMDSVIAFIPFSSEDLLLEEMENWLLSAGTYENLLANHLVTNVDFTELPTTTGTSYQCIYNTSRVTGLILRYHTYTNPETNITYVLSETFSPDNQLQSNSLFVFDGNNSFMCYGNDVSLTISTACDLYSSIVK